MPPLLILSPRVLDQSVPRDAQQLRLAAISVTEVRDYCELGKARVLITDAVISMLDNYCWSGVERGDLLATVYEFHAGLASHPSLSIHLEFKAIPHQARSLPCGLTSDGLADVWADEVGIVAAWHEALVAAPDACVAIVCDEAFAGQRPACPDTDTLRVVGPDEASQLSDAFEPDLVPAGQVTFQKARENVHILGGTPASRMESSHLKVAFRDGTFWVLDKNHDPIPDRELQQVAAKIDRSLAYVKLVLATGRRPPDRFKLREALAS